MKKIIITIGTAALFALSSCSVTYPGIATSNPIGSKTGVAERKIFFGLSFNTDVSIETAAKKAGISKISTVDFSKSKGLISTTYRTIVTGE